MTFRMTLYGGSPYRIVGLSASLKTARGAGGAPSALASVDEPDRGWLDLETNEETPRRFRCFLTLSPTLAGHVDGETVTLEHPGSITQTEAISPDDAEGPGPVLVNEGKPLPTPDAELDPSELFGPCVLLVPSNRLHRALNGTYVLMAAPEGTRDGISEGRLPEPTEFHYAAFIGEQHRFTTAEPVPFHLRAGMVTAIADRASGVAVARPSLL